MVLMDAYFAEGIPFHLVTREFFEQLKAKLTPGGVAVANIVGALGGSNSKLFRAIYKTYAAEVAGLYLFPAGCSTGKEDEPAPTIQLLPTPRPGATRHGLAARLT